MQPDAIRIEPLTRPAGQAPWAIAVFAHNEAGRIGAALASIAGAAGGNPVSVYVLCNGCTDTTVAEVRAAAGDVDDLTLVEIESAGKANAWNVFVHDVPDAHRFSRYFFMDGDVRLEPDALPRLARALAEAPVASAAGGMPAGGRDREAWGARMVAKRILAGNLYALRDGFVDRLREQRVRMPVGLIGDDFLVSWLVGSDIGQSLGRDGQIRCVFRPDAQFSFRSLSPWRPRDYRAYLRRRWGYVLRDLQHQMLIVHLMRNGIAAMPRDIDQLYRVAPLPSRLAWVGLETPLRTLAVLRIRAARGGNR